ncbi:hypothetical protein SAMD00019534_078980 [Acytostelium subglobosum LB1]|uniref:hypothetical protein n=1 Tax=Acytostelium subglobosum LB1 TaxID=1410327 RepID=UPI000645049A|nr:hypothetical protein SAMD00019534_078980 [Acytostelium subglobosum LB1]GAM24723.1 hypothetical protein SAMD00019534_078980 [Acytostelium subglobosum LB1]|eukprot:XP_012752392.1 hypothetical protein SAMD00019534_078980 [Acytostelium subglobosum LB1]
MSNTEDCVRELLRKIVKIWDELGVENTYRAQQCDEASQQVVNIYTTLMKREEKYKDDVIKNILTGLESVCTMTTELGETVKESNKPLANMNLLQRESYVESQLGALRKRTEDRVVMIEDLETKIEDISKELELKDLNHSRMNESDISGNDYSMERISSLQKKMKKLQLQRNDAFTKVKKLCAEIGELWGELRIAPDTEFEKSIERMIQSSQEHVSPISLSMSTITVLSQKIDKLHLIKKESEALVCELASKITNLWNKMGTPEDERDSFFSKTAGLGPDVIEACNEELFRIEELRRACLSDLIDKAVVDIEELYLQMHMANDRLDELLQGVEEGTEEHLELLEKELEDVTKMYEVAKPLIDLIEKREDIRNAKIEYEQNVLGDKERLLSKKFDRNRFVQEENMRKAMAKLPTVEERLKKDLIEWQNTQGFAFTYDGFNYLELMMQQADNERIKKDLEKMRKEKERQNKMEDAKQPVATKKVVTATTKTPSKSVAAPALTKSSSNAISSASVGPGTPSTPKTPRVAAIKKDEAQSPYNERAMPAAAKKRAPLSPLSLNNGAANGVLNGNGHVAKKKVVTINPTPSGTKEQINVKKKQLLVSSPLKNGSTKAPSTSSSISTSSVTSASSIKSRLMAAGGYSKQPTFNHDQSIVCNYQYGNEDLLMNEDFE